MAILGQTMLEMPMERWARDLAEGSVAAVLWYCFVIGKHTLLTTEPLELPMA
jgi:hypothetical protein